MTYEHLCENCSHEWEEQYSIKQSPPTICPSCNEEGFVKRLVSGGAGRAIVRLSGHEFTEKLKSETRQIKKQFETNENYRAAFVGEEKYHNDLIRENNVINDLVNIGKDNSKTKTSGSQKKTNKKSLIKRVK